VSSGSVLDAVREELKRVATSALEESEIQKTKNNISHAFLSRLTRVSYIGESLARCAVYQDDANCINSELERFMRVTAADIQQAADRAFRQDNEALIIVEPSRRVS
jgi:predicted Zn-dependent peptidase